MDWIKKNTVLVVGALIALLAMGGAGYYLYTNMNKSAEISAKFDSAVQRRNGFVKKRPNHPGFEKVDNIKIAKEDYERLNQFQSELLAGFRSTVPSEPTERGFKSALAEVMEEIEIEGDRSGLTIPTNFNLSFTAQKVSYKFASNSLGPLSVQLADLGEIAKILVDARVNSIESFKRVKVSEDDSGDNAVADEYLTRFAITTNSETKALVYPYEVSFRCFSEELGDVLEGVASSPYSILVKTIAVEPANIRSSIPKRKSAASLYEGLPGLAPRVSSRGGVPTAGGRSDDRMSSRYGGGARRSAPNSRAGTSAGLPPMFDNTPQVQTGPEVLLQPEPLKVTLGLAVIRMPEADIEDSSKN